MLSSVVFDPPTPGRREDHEDGDGGDPKRQQGPMGTQAQLVEVKGAAGGGSNKSKPYH